MPTFISITGRTCHTESRRITRHPHHEYLCDPISFDYFAHPIIIDAAPNCVYDHKTLFTWLSTSNKNPTTGETLDSRIKIRPFVNLFAAMLCMEERGGRLIFHRPRMDTANLLSLARRIMSRGPGGAAVELDAAAHGAHGAGHSAHGAARPRAGKCATYKRLLFRDIAGGAITNPVINIFGNLADAHVHRPHDQAFCGDADPVPIDRIFAAMGAAAPPERIRFDIPGPAHENMRGGDFYMSTTTTAESAYRIAAAILARDEKKESFAAARRTLSGIIARHPHFITEPHYGGDTLFSAIRADFDFPVMNRGTYTEDFSLLDLSKTMFLPPDGGRAALKGAEFVMTDLRGAFFARIDFSVCAFIGADLRGTSFVSCTFRECSFYRAAMNNETRGPPNVL